MWGHMGGQGMNMMGSGMGSGMGGGMLVTSLVWLGIVIWLVVFTILVLNRMDKIIQLLENKK